MEEILASLSLQNLSHLQQLCVSVKYGEKEEEQNGWVERPPQV
jgi:hypothetical protein